MRFNSEMCGAVRSGFVRQSGIAVVSMAAISSGLDWLWNVAGIG